MRKFKNWYNRNAQSDVSPKVVVEKSFNNVLRIWMNRTLDNVCRTNRSGVLLQLSKLRKRSKRGTGYFKFTKFGTSKILSAICLANTLITFLGYNRKVWAFQSGFII